MDKEFRFPDVGEGITEGTVVEVHVSEGGKIQKDAPICSVETDKAIVEIPSPYEGTVKKLFAIKGQVVKVGQQLMIVDTEDTHEVLSHHAPSESQHVQKQAPQAPASFSHPQAGARVMASPATRKLARDLNVEIEKLKGTGAGGRITDEDVRSASQGKSTQMQPRPMQEQKIPANEFSSILQGKMQEQQRPVAAGTGFNPSPSVKRTPVTVDGPAERIPLAGVRKAISEKMSESKYTAPHVAHIDEADLTELWDVRKKETKIAEQKGVKLTFLPFVAKAVVAALRKFPYINSSLDLEKNEIVLKKYYNIGIAVETENGLFVPVVKGADKKSILQIAKDIQELAEKARSRKISIDEMKGGTFTITNVGSIGGLISTPIINYPEAAILGFHKIEDRPVAIEGKVEVRKMVYLALSFDHRLIDGAVAASFMNEVIALLEDPSRLLVDVI